MVMNDRCYEWTISGSKLISEFEKKLDDYRAQDKKIITANGCFDIFHFGHLSLLTEAKSLGDVLIVGVNSDRTVRKIKGAGRPIFPEKERASLLVSLEFVDHVIIYDDILPNELLGTIRPDIHCISGEYSDTKLPEKDIVESFGGKVKVLSFIPGHSTTNIIQKIHQHTTDSDAQASPSKGKDAITDYLFESSNSIRCLAYQHSETLLHMAELMVNVIRTNGKIIFYGNGGSEAEAQRFAAELIRRFVPREKPFPVIALSGDRSEVSNTDKDYVFFRQLEAVGKPGDLLVILSTNGESKDVIMAGDAARGIGMQIIGFTGNANSYPHGLWDEILSVDSNKPTIIQQSFMAACNSICYLLERLIK
jgi:rfaE bifunctional protein nucleotidyltransferase chain/domain